MLFARIIALFRRPKHVPAPDAVVGMAWYSDPQWRRLREVSVDGVRLERTHEEWLHAAQDRYDALRKEGVNVVKVPVDVEDLASWCRELGRVVDPEGRVAYVKNRIAQVQMGNIAKL